MLKKLFSAIGSLLKFVRNSIINVCVFIIGLVLISAFFSSEETVTVQNESALVLNLSGDLVIQKRFISPFQQLENEIAAGPDQFREVLLQDVLTAISRAKDDARITTIVLDVSRLNRAGLDKLFSINAALEDFKSTGKTVNVNADYYSQNQYLLASSADNLFMHPMGAVFLDGFGRYQNYYKDALEKFNITAHVFRVGTYKSAVEPYIRSDMSESAMAANLEWIDSLWYEYKQAVSINRSMELNNFDETLDSLLNKLAQTNGNYAQYAVDNQWVDKLVTRKEFREFMHTLVASSESDRGYRHINYDDYLYATSGQPSPAEFSNDNVAVIAAKGTILDGRQAEGDIGGDSTAALLRKARLDDTVKAVVLYIDSPGGSAFASEIIRQQIVALKTAGKPVVSVMSSVAASGGYWIATETDEIWASASTITGSIGVYGMFLSFEKGMDYLGINNDGVGTTELSGLSPLRALNPKAGQMIQMSVENNYHKFVQLVANTRGISYQAVDAVAQGRVWTGQAALQHGLVDHLGDIDDAIEAAATLAGLESYEHFYLERDKSPEEMVLQELFGTIKSWLPPLTKQQLSADITVKIAIQKVLQDISSLTQFNDPNGLYLHCESCSY